MGSHGKPHAVPLQDDSAIGLPTGMLKKWQSKLAACIRTGICRLRSPGARSPGQHPTAADEAASLGTVSPEASSAESACTLAQWRWRHNRLQREIARLQAIYRLSHDAVILVDPDRRIVVDANPRAGRLVGVTTEKLKGRSFFDLHDESPDFLRSLLDDVLDGKEGRALRLSYRSESGRSVPAEVSLSHIAWEQGRLLLCIARDLSEREAASAQIEHLAYHDNLTGLPNRALLTDRVNRALARSRRTRQSGALLFLDLDKFKRINDSLGHAIGDELLRGMAVRLRRAVREEDTVARLGGDEFVVLLEGIGQGPDVAAATAQEIAQKLRHAFEEPFTLHGHELYVTASIGIVTYPKDGDSVDTLLRHADTAMYHAKGAGRDAAQIFERKMDEAAMSRLRFEQDLRRGLRDEQFTLHFQPVQEIRTGKALGAEVLLRWQHPEDGQITPSEFLPYIENSALMLRLGDWVLRATCQVLARLQSDPSVEAPNCLGVNISHQQLEQADFVDRVLGVLEQTGADPRRLQFEITEPVLVRDDQAVSQRMHTLKRHGIRFALDDFGTGYSSLGDLRRLPIETLKIDRSLVRDIANDPHDEAIVRAILSMAEHLGLQVVAEGVETQAQLAVLRDADCTYYQGYIGRPPIDLSTYQQELAFSLQETRDAV